MGRSVPIKVPAVSQKANKNNGFVLASYGTALKMIKLANTLTPKNRKLNPN
jgi:hypothetical protein